MATNQKDPLQDLREFLEVLNRREVLYLVIGAHAMSHWGYTRATGDLDILVQPSTENSLRVAEALREYGAPMKGIAPKDFTKPHQVLQLGVAPLRIDILTSIDGVDEARVFRTSKKGELLGVPVRFINLPDLIKNKAASGRPKDILDVKELRKVKKQAKQ